MGTETARRHACLDTAGWPWAACGSSLCIHTWIDIDISGEAWRRRGVGSAAWHGHGHRRMHGLAGHQISALPWRPGDVTASNVLEKRPRDAMPEQERRLGALGCPQRSRWRRSAAAGVLAMVAALPRHLRPTTDRRPPTTPAACAHPRPQNNTTHTVCHGLAAALGHARRRPRRRQCAGRHRVHAAG